MVNLRLTAIGRLEGLDLRQTGIVAGRESRKGTRKVWFKGAGRVDCAIHDRDAMGAGAEAPGPAVIEAIDTTIVIPPGWTARADDNGYIIMEAVQ